MQASFIRSFIAATPDNKDSTANADITEVVDMEMDDVDPEAERQR